MRIAEDDLGAELKFWTACVTLVVTSAFVARHAPQLRRTRLPRRLVVSLVFCCAVVTLSEVVTQLSDSAALCSAGGFVTNLFDLASNLVALAIAHNLRETIRRPRSRNLYVEERRYHASVWVTATLVSLLPWTTGSYGEAGHWCWIREDPAYWRALCFYGPLWIGMPTIVWWYVDTGRRIADIKRGVGVSDPTIYAVKKLSAMPMIFVLCRIAPSASRIVEYAGAEWGWLVAAHGVSESVQGTLYVLVFYRRTIRRWLCQGSTPSSSASSSSAAQRLQGEMAKV